MNNLFWNCLFHFESFKLLINIILFLWNQKCFFQSSYFISQDKSGSFLSNACFLLILHHVKTHISFPYTCSFEQTAMIPRNILFNHWSIFVFACQKGIILNFRNNTNYIFGPFIKIIFAIKLKIKLLHNKWSQVSRDFRLKIFFVWSHLKLKRCLLSNAKILAKEPLFYVF